jgi:beta-glucosidase
MCSYNKINGVYACENDDTLNRILKEELGFQGFIQSDWQATMSGVPSALAGLDMTMPGDITFGSGNSYFGGNLTEAVKNGSVPLSRVNDMATRIFASWYKLGQENNYPTVGVNFVNYTDAPFRNVQHDHKKTIREIGGASTILLQNNGGALPLKSPKSIGIIGSDGGPSPNNFGPNACADHGCDVGTLAEGWGSGTAWFPYLVNPFPGLKARAPRSTQFKTSFDDYDLATAASIAKSVEVPIVFVNADSGEGYINVGGNPGDRSNLTLWHGGDALIEAVADANPNTIVVIHTVGAVLMPWLNKVKAVVNAGLPGQESGNALADVLFGDVNPSGRLPYTMAKKTSDYPSLAEDVSEVNYTEGLLIGHRWFDAKNIEPLFPFGHGLSYTKFSYNGLKVKKSSSTVTVTATIRNAGKVDGAEVPQLYVGFPKSAGEPPKVLRGFEKVMIKAGKSAKVTFEVDVAKELSIWDSDARKWKNVKGSYEVYVGASSRDIRLQGSFSL